MLPTVYKVGRNDDCGFSDKCTISFTNVDTVDILPARPIFKAFNINVLTSASVPERDNNAAHNIDMMQAAILLMSVPIGRYFHGLEF